MRAALGLPVPQIKREKKRLEDSDLVVCRYIVFLLQTLLGRSDNSQKELKGERVMGAGKGPVRQLDVVAEVSFSVFLYCLEVYR